MVFLNCTLYFWYIESIAFYISGNLLNSLMHSNNLSINYFGFSGANYMWKKWQFYFYRSITFFLLSFNIYIIYIIYIYTLYIYISYCADYPPPYNIAQKL